LLIVREYIQWTDGQQKGINIIIGALYIYQHVEYKDTLQIHKPKILTLDV